MAAPVFSPVSFETTGTIKSFWPLILTAKSIMYKCTQNEKKKLFFVSLIGLFKGTKYRFFFIVNSNCYVKRLLIRQL